MPEPRPQRQMVDMAVFETSGVDHPAHGFEGWLVKKSAGPGRVARLESIMRGKTMPQSKEDLLKEVAASKLPESVKEFVTKAIDLTPEIDAAAKLWQDLRAKQEAGDPETPSVETPAAPVVAEAPAAPVVPGADLFGKSLNAAETESLAKAMAENPGLAKAFGVVADTAKAALAKAAEERDARLDAEAIEVSKAAYKHVAIDHATVAPALRKMAESAPAQYAVVKAAMDAAEGQLEAAGMFKEIGTTRAANSGTAMEKAKGIAAAFITAGAVKTEAEGLAKAFAENPSLYTEYEKEGAV